MPYKDGLRMRSENSSFLGDCEVVQKSLTTFTEIKGLRGRYTSKLGPVPISTSFTQFGPLLTVEFVLHFVGSVLITHVRTLLDVFSHGLSRLLLE